MQIFNVHVCGVFIYYRALGILLFSIYMLQPKFIVIYIIYYIYYYMLHYYIMYMIYILYMWAG